MRGYLVFVCMVLMATLLGGRHPAGGFLWDLVNALGFCGLAALAYLGWDSQSPARQPALRLHSNIAIVAAVLAGAHALVFLVWDPTVIEYLKLKAPWYMHAGTLGLVCLLVLAITSYPAPRRRIYQHFGRFQRWHLALSIAAVALALWHVLGAGFYVSRWYHQVALCALAIGAPLFAYRRRRAGTPSALLMPVVSIAHADTQGLLGLVSAIVAALVYAGLKNV